MTIRRSIGLACAALLAASGAACAGMGKEQRSENPNVNAAHASQQQSEQALQNAAESQKKASEQAKKAAEAQAEVQKLQRELTQAQQKARQEQAKAEQMQQQASQQTQQSTARAQTSQEAASQALSRANEQVSRGHMAARGTVTETSANELVLRPESSDQPMTFRVNDQTKVRIDGREASVTDIQQGQDALVSYEAGTLQPNALTVQVVTGNVGGSPQGTGSSGSYGAGSGTSSSPSGTSSSPGGTSSSPGSAPDTGSSSSGTR